MTAAERQRRCRANGKGRHRGSRLTRAQIRLEQERILAAARALAAGQPAVEMQPALEM